jgi:hypothetical protein
MRKVSSRFLLSAGLILATVGYVAYGLEATVLDAHRVNHAAHDMLKTSPVRDPLSRRLAYAIATHMPPGVPLDQPMLEQASHQALKRPAFVDAFSGALIAVQQHVFSHGTGLIALNTTLVTDAARQALTEVDAPAAGLLPPDTQLIVLVDTDKIPDLGIWAGPIRITARAAGLLGAVMLVLGFATDKHRARALGRIGRWMLMIGIVQLIFFVALPKLVLPQFGGWAEVAGTVISTGSFFVAPALALIGFGIGMIVFGGRWSGVERRHVLAVLPTVRTRRVSHPLGHWESPV